MFGPLNFPSVSLTSTSAPGNHLLCFLCDQKFDINCDREEYMNHILESHNVIIKDYDNIMDLLGYVSYWREKFKLTNIKEICCGETNEIGPGEKKEPCYILSSSIKEDKELREQLLKNSLQKALEKQKYEREDTKFSRRCLFCNHDFGPTRSEYLNHLSLQHNLQLGKPDNLVYIDEFISLIENKIESLKCIFCEKTFKDRNVLKEHMRKKLHKRVNPKNPIYDQFYMVNYIAPGKSNKKLLERKRRKSSDDDDYDCDWSDWKEDSTEVMVCLFCIDSFPSWDSILQHLNNHHHFDYKTISAEMNFYDQVKMVNYIRRQIYKNLCIVCSQNFEDRSALLGHMEKENHLIKPKKELWDHPEFFFPTYENDGFLCHLEEPDTHKEDEDTRERKGIHTMFHNQEKPLSCLFCDTSSLSGQFLIDHMSSLHDFPYYDFMEDFNFMDRVKLMNYTRNQLASLKCINCDKSSSSIEELITHMKQLNHYIAPNKNLWINSELKKLSCVKNNDQDCLDSVDFLYALEDIGGLSEGKMNVTDHLSEYSDYEEDGVPIVCLFCKIESSCWSDCLNHMASDHKFDFVSLTKPLTFYQQVKLVVYIRNKVKESVCPVCENASSDLLSHLDQQDHYSIPLEHLWDQPQYYPSSFIGDPFLSELNVYHATGCLDVSPLESNGSIQMATKEKDKSKSAEVDEEDTSDWSDWDEEMKIPVLCLFCENISDSWNQVLNHLKSAHNFSYTDFSSGLSFYDQLKVVNYMRERVSHLKCINCSKEGSSRQDLLDHMTKEDHLKLPGKESWDVHKYFTPTLENDGFLAHLDDGSDIDDI